MKRTILSLLGLLALGATVASAQLATLDFEELATGNISGQGAWMISNEDQIDLATVVEGDLAYPMAAGGAQVLQLSGSPETQMTRWLEYTLGEALPNQDIYMSFLLNTDRIGNDDFRSEAFVRLDGWGLFVAAKFTEGILELTGDQLVIDEAGLPVETTHLAVIKLDVDTDGNITGSHVWLNPAHGDVNTPLLSKAVEGKTVADIDVIDMRSQRSVTLIDDIKIGTAWNDVVPMPSAAFSFEDLDLGQIAGQGMWTIRESDLAKALVVDGGLVYAAADGSLLNGGNQALQLVGTPEEQNTRFLTHPLGPLAPDQDMFFRMMLNTDRIGSDDFRSEVFMRLAGWGLFVAVKFTEGLIEINGEQLAIEGLTVEQTHLLVGQLDVEGDMVVGVNLWLNPGCAGGDPIFSVEGLEVPVANISNLEMRSQRSITTVDEVVFSPYLADVLPGAWASFGFEDLMVGPIDGQGSWDIDDGQAALAQVINGGLGYMSADEGMMILSNDSSRRKLAMSATKSRASGQAAFAASIIPASMSRPALLGTSSWLRSRALPTPSSSTDAAPAQVAT